MKASLQDQVKTLISRLSLDKHKGQAGRIGIVGGSRDYSGAPFFASMASMRLGCDLSFTICSPEAGRIIKTYSPDLIVPPILDETKPFSQIKTDLETVFKRLHAVVLGPGLGRDEFMQNCAKLVIELAKENEMYLVIDADGLWLLQNHPELIKGYKRAILTPNVIEFQRLCKALDIDCETQPNQAAKQLAIALQGPTILQKGKVDKITNGTETIECDVEASLKRCGGQGDILSGCLGTFSGWCKIYQEEQHTQIESDRLLLVAGYGAALTTRMCSRMAFQKHRRAMLADDLLPQVGTAYEELFGDQHSSSVL